jgi:hypothetical protein
MFFMGGIVMREKRPYKERRRQDRNMPRDERVLDLLAKEGGFASLDVREILRMAQEQERRKG